MASKFKRGVDIVSTGSRYTGQCFGTTIKACRYMDKPAWKVLKEDGKTVCCLQKNMQLV